ncbi:MAG: DUF1640 domain-containing protein [Magnetococcales bacterium]|nr:DUF1640 domain-containing protein [Magnetococcales bacterium]
MTTITFDTLEYMEYLKAAGVPDEQAKAHAKAMIRAVGQMEESQRKELATKGDIQLLKGDLHVLKDDIRQVEVKIAESRAEIIKWMIGVSAGQVMFILAFLKLFPPH